MENPLAIVERGTFPLTLRDVFANTHIVEVAPETTISEVKELLRARFYPRFELHEGYSWDTLPVWKQKKRQCDFLLVDGGHSAGAARKDLQSLREVAAPQAKLVVDDVNNNRRHDVRGDGIEIFLLVHGAVAVRVGLGHEFFYVFKAYVRIILRERPEDLVGGQLAVSINIDLGERL